ncbi:30S ribosomal protein 3, chloroplastic [Zostera marina]|uniref:30S ribosomal protein 3, chloroplastic n=1 Tax=Zostera marina TaxID=29655 RepID=A0A0K9PV68_ZOSMR|nr:30S ribosomal protein 3, chloroplastic [Zostera marina]
MAMAGSSMSAVFSPCSSRLHCTNNESQLKPLFSLPCLSQNQALPKNSIRISQKKDGVWRRAVVAPSAADMAAADTPPESPLEKEKVHVVVKTVEKPRLVLKFIWMEKNIGLGLDQSIPGHGTIPLSPYYFWPRKDAWEELKALMESKQWISQKRMIILLNQATDIINLWQQSGGGL